jgi:uncharacterized protein YukE
MAAISESVAVDSALAPPESHHGNFAPELRFNAGALLGGVDWFAEKAFGVSPLQDWVLKPFAGNWDQFDKAAQAWGSAGKAADGVGMNFGALTSQSVDAWQGDAGDKFRDRMESLSENYKTYAEGCAEIGKVADGLMSVSKAAAATVSMVVGFVSDLLERLIVEASVPVAGWLAGAADVALHIKQFWTKAREVYQTIERVVNAVREVINALNLVANRLLRLKTAMNAFAGGADVSNAAHVDSAAAKAFGTS